MSSSDADVEHLSICIYLWPPCVADADICPVVSSFFFFFPRLISAVGHWMSTILLHVVWP